MESKIHLCSVEPTDIETLFVWENDREFWDSSNTILPVSRHSLEILVICNMESTLAQEKQARFMIKLGDTKQPKQLVSVGIVDIFDYQTLHKRISCGIFIAPEFQGKGYGKTALQLLAQHGKKHLGLHQLYCEVLASNTKSLALFKKIGFVECGRKKDWIWHDEGFCDVLCLQKLL
ncbi:MAG: GNAT family protein [Bacteroidales bacterium]